MMLPNTSLVGVTLADGRYEVKELLGSGGMAAVYRVRDLRLDRDVAIKVPHARLLQADPTFERRFLAEMRSLVTVSHPHVVKIIDAGRHEAGPYAVLEFLPGGTLLERMIGMPADAPRTSRWRELLQWLAPIADALDCLHAQRLVHRDVKPANILFDAQGRPYLSDFGLVRVVGDSSSRLTQPGIAVGTPGFLAPEATRFAELDGRADQFALAVTAHYFLLGRLPYDGLHFRTARTGSDGTSSSDGVPVPVVEALLRGAADHPDERFSSCSDFVSALRSAWAVGDTVALTPAPKNSQVGPPQSQVSRAPQSPDDGARATRRTIAFAGVAIGLAVAFAAWLLSPPSEAELIQRNRGQLIGQWRNEAGLKMEFFPDGRFQEQRLFDTGHGRYELLSARRMRLETQGMFNNLLPTGGEGFVEYKVLGDELTLTSESSVALTMRFKRIP